jgi:hyperosmotically inducible protein
MSHAASDKAASAPVNAASKAERAVSDSWITTKVKSEILANSVSKAFNVSVKTKHGVVLLKGKLPSQDAIDLVKMIAEKVKGVKSVDVSGLVIGS